MIINELKRNKMYFVEYDSFCQVVSTRGSENKNFNVSNVRSGERQYNFNVRPKTIVKAKNKSKKEAEAFLEKYMPKSYGK
jgi:hypothetical protein